MKIAGGNCLGLKSLSLGLLAGQVAVAGANPLPPKPGQDGGAATARLKQGEVKGFTDSHGNNVFLGIPFADTTGGENRYVPNTKIVSSPC
jgi:hypothetical protein